MKTRRLIFTAIAICLITFGVVGQADWWWPFSKKDNAAKYENEFVELTWQDLVPEDFVQPENPFVTMSQEQIEKLMDGSKESNAELDRLQKEFNYAPVVEKLDGQRIKLAAYITPLEFDGQTRMKEFLLVPYVGACMHTPPPPANQVVHAKSPETIELGSIYEPVWAIGTIRAETVKSALAESGYKLEVEEVLPYSE